MKGTSKIAGAINKLTAKQIKFCEAMIECNYNQCKAYHIAYPDANESTCRSNSARIMNIPGVREYIIELQKQAFLNACITPERIAKELEKMAFAELDENNTNQTKAKAMELLQKQYGWQSQMIKADVNANVNMIEIGIDDGTDEDAD